MSFPEFSAQAVLEGGPKWIDSEELKGS